MIIRERDDEFVLVEQHIHAKMSGDIMSNWKDELFLGGSLRNSVEYAIFNHDLGWKLFDQQPFWDELNERPYSFSSFPTLPKIVLYKHGIDEVEKQDKYAALLCSEHYSRFLVNNTSIEAQDFVNQEKARQEMLRQELAPVDEQLFNFHYGLVQLGDNLSLYICLNEPGIEKKDEHRFFKNGIPLNTSLIGFQDSKLHINWKSPHSVEVHEFPFQRSFKAGWKEKVVTKQLIKAEGLMTAYAETPFEEKEVEIVPK